MSWQPSANFKIKLCGHGFFFNLVYCYIQRSSYDDRLNCAARTIPRWVVRLSIFSIQPNGFFCGCLRHSISQAHESTFQLRRELYLDPTFHSTSTDSTRMGVLLVDLLLSTLVPLIFLLLYADDCVAILAKIK
jgi:hypothetical protein